MMKKITLLLFLLGSHLNAQIVYDFSKGQFAEKITPVKTGEFVVLKINNVNTFRYKVEIEGKSINYVTPVPSELQTLFRLQDQVTTQQKTNDALKDIQAAQQLVQQNGDDVNKKFRGVSDSPQTDVDKKKDELRDALDKLVEATREYAEIAQNIASVKFKRIELINIAKQKWESFSQMDEKLGGFLSESEMRTSYNGFIAYYAKIESLFQEAESKVLLVNDADIKKNVHASLADARKKMEKGHENITEENFLKLIGDVLLLQAALKNPENFNVVSPPIQVDGDFVYFKVKVTPVQTNDLLPYESAKAFSIEVPAKGGWKSDFSVGPAISFGKNAKDELYFTQTTLKKDTLTLKSRANNNAISPAMAAMMHFYPRNGKNATFSFLFGVGAGFQTINDLNLSLYGGAGTVLGKRQKIMVNVGLSYFRVNRLKTDQFEYNKDYPSDQLISNNAVEKVFKQSFFFSISYNITNTIEVK